MSDTFFRRIIKKPPVLFPLVALFHIGMLLYTTWQFSPEPFPSPVWVQPLWWLLYTISWIFICDMKRWAAMMYIGLTALNLVLRYVIKSSVDLSNFTDAMFPVDVLFTFFVMFYFRRFD